MFAGMGFVTREGTLFWAHMKQLYKQHGQNHDE